IRFDAETPNPIPKPILRGTTIQSSQLASPFYPSLHTWAAVMSSRFGADVLTLHDRDEIIEGIIRFLKTHSQRIGAKHLIVGMSGGVDSSVAAVLCSMAVGGRETLGFCLPEDETRNPANIRDAEGVARKFGIKLETIEITHLIKATTSVLHPSKANANLPLGHVKASLRTLIVYYFDNNHKIVVVGTGDKSEIML